MSDANTWAWKVALVMGKSWESGPMSYNPKLQRRNSSFSCPDFDGSGGTPAVPSNCTISCDPSEASQFHITGLNHFFQTRYGWHCAEHVHFSWPIEQGRLWFQGPKPSILSVAEGKILACGVWKKLLATAHRIRVPKLQILDILYIFVMHIH